MISIDRIDKKVIKVLGENREMNLSQLWIKTFSKEGQKSFRDRLNRLEGLNIIKISKVNNGKSLEYIIKLKDNNNG